MSGGSPKEVLGEANMLKDPCTRRWNLSRAENAVVDPLRFLLKMDDAEDDNEEDDEAAPWDRKKRLASRDMDLKYVSKKNQKI